MRLEVALLSILAVIAFVSFSSAENDPNIPRCTALSQPDVDSWTTVKDKKNVTLHDLQTNLGGGNFLNYKGTYDVNGWSVKAVQNASPVAIIFHLGTSGDKYNIFNLFLQGERHGYWYWIDAGLDCIIEDHAYDNIISVNVMQFNYRVAHNS